MKTRIQQSFRMNLFGSLFVAMAIVMMAFSGSAQAADTHGATGHAGTISAPAELVGVEIVLQHGKAIYIPTRLNLKVNQHFNSSNDTKVLQTETYLGGPLVNIPPHQDIEAWWGQKGTYILGLSSNPQAKLTIVVS